jgi:hypothetical protein
MKLKGKVKKLEWLTELPKHNRRMVHTSTDGLVKSTVTENGVNNNLRVMAYYTISKRSGVCLNEQKTDFNTKANHVAKFESEEAAQKWIDENGHIFKSAATGKSIKLIINKHERGGAGRGQGPKFKYGEPTKPMRIPLSLVSEVEKIIAKKR